MTPMLWLAMWLAGGAAQATIDPAMRIEVSASSYRADGTRDMEVRYRADSPRDMETRGDVLWIDPVNCAGGTSRMSSPTAVSWEVSGRIVEQNGDAFVIEVNVHRSDREPMPPRTISARIGERVLLDELLGAPKSCWTVVHLEASVVRSLGVRSGVASGAPGGVAVVGSGTAPRGGGGGGGVASGVSAGPRGGVSGGGGGGAAVGASGSGRGGATLGISNRPGGGMSAAMFAAAMGMGESGRVMKNGVPITDHSVPMHPIDDASYDVEVWLVHRIPQGQDETLKQTGHIGRDGRVFEFAAMHVSTDRGVVDVSVAGMLRPMTLDDGSLVLRASIARVLSGAGNSTGSSVTAIPMPGPADAVSFETPGVSPRFPVPDPMPGHTFSIVVKIAHGK